MTSPSPEPPVTMLTEALRWAGWGVPVLLLHHPVEGADGVLRCSCKDPECASPAKHPITDRELGLRNGLTQATTDPATITKWWTRYAGANVGGCTGGVIDLVDIDTAEGMKRYAELTDNLESQPEHLGVAQSGRDGFGMHVYVGPGGMKALQQGKTAPPGIDVKGRGGYAVLPPSRHISGRRYIWLSNHFDSGELAGTVSWPEFYKRLEVRPTPPARQRPRSAIVIPTDAANAYGRAVLHRAVSLIESSMSGNRWQTLATEAIPLIARGVDGGCIDRDSGVRELEEAARGAGLSRREVGRIGSLVDNMIHKGIRNPIHPKDAVREIGDLMSPATLLDTPTSPPRFRVVGNDENADTGTGGAESRDSDDDSDDDDESAAYTGDPRTDPWDPPWPLRYPTPPFPAEVLDWMAPEVTNLADRLQCPVDLVAMMTIAGVAATIRGRIRAEVVDGWEEPLNLYIAIVAGAGESKSPALKRILDPLDAMELEAKERYAQTAATLRFDQEIAEAHAKKLREAALGARDGQDREMALEKARQAQADAEAIVVPSEPVYLLGEPTPEALVAELAQQNGVLAHLSAEGALFDTIVGGRYSKGVPQLSDLLRAHDGRETIKVHRKHAPTIVVRNPCMTIGLAVQPDVLRKLGENDAAMGRGLAARFLFSIPSSMVGHRDRRLRRSSEGFRGFWALIRGVDLLAGGGASGGEGFGDFGHRISENVAASEGSERWRIAGTPVAASTTSRQGFGDFGHRSTQNVASPGSDEAGVGTAAPGVLGISGTAPYKYVFGDSSSSLLELYFDDLEARRPAGTGDLSDLGAWSNKLDGQLVRLAAILQLIRDVRPDGLEASSEAHQEAPEPRIPRIGAQNPRNPRWEISVEAVSDARILVDYLIAHAVEAHAVMTNTEGGPALTRAKQLLGWIQTRGKTEFTAHEAQRSLRNGVSFREPDAVRQACATLLQLGWLRLVPPEPGKPGRPSLRFIAHPDIHTAQL